jgi:hypothetical protein
MWDMTWTSASRKAAVLITLCVGEGMTTSAASNWTLQFPTGNVGGNFFNVRSGHMAVYDPSTNNMIVFGGTDVVATHASSNDVSLLSNANGLGGAPNWSTLLANGLPGSPPPRTLGAALYDQANNRLIIFGGATYANLNSNPSAYLNDVWVLTNANGQGGTPAWIKLNPSGPLPAPRYAQSAVYDAAGNRLIIYGGGFSSTTFFDVWVLSHANGLGGTPAWQKLSPSGGVPFAGYSASAIYDPANNIMTVFGGYYRTSLSPFGFVLCNYVWTLSHANGVGGTPQWTNIIANGAAGSPGKRTGHTAIYDPASNRMTIFGGGSFTPNESPGYNDVWVLANANGLGGTPTWTQLLPAGAAPARRGDHTAVYDAANNRMVMFGGDSFDGLFYGVWTLTGANGL